MTLAHDDTQVQRHTNALGEEDSIWFQLTALLKVDDPIKQVVRLSEKLGGCIPVRLKSQRIWLLSDTEHFRHVLVSNTDNYTKYFEGMTAIFGQSMITVDGALWQKIRAPQQKSFHPKAFGEYYPYFQEAVLNKKSKFDALAESGEEFELVSHTWELAADMICKALFDRDMPFNPKEVFSAVKSYTDVMNHKNIRVKRVAGELQEIGEEDAARAIDTWWSVPPMMVGAVPKDHREKSLMAALEAARDDESQPDFTQQQVVDELKQYLWAGTETTALTLAWAMYLMTKHPEAAAKVRAEAEEVYGDREPSFDDIGNLTYTRNVIQETMRMYPPVWSVIRVAEEDDQIGEHEIKAGDKLVMCIYAVHHNSKIWTNPENFDPTRFAPDRMKKRAKYSYLPFSAGKRACIGGQLSLVENTLALSTIMRHFEPEYVGPEPAQMNATVTLTPKGGLPFKIHKRA